MLADYRSRVAEEGTEIAAKQALLKYSSYINLYIKMKNDKDLHIDDLDILSFLGGQAGIYTAMEFNDGVKSHTDQEMTSRYDGNFVLFDNSHSRAKSDKGALFIFYGRDNKIGGIEIQSYLCRCKVRIFLADYQEGLKILN